MKSVFGKILQRGGTDMKSIREVFKIGRGPSSSHTMGPERAATLFRSEHPDADAFRVQLYGSLCKTGKGHGTDRVLYETFSPLPTEVVFCDETPEDVTHPNTMDFTALKGDAVIGTMRALSIGGGDIRIDGVSIYDIPRKKLHEMISMVLQETWTFRGTIRDNIVYSNREVTEERIREVVENCGLSDFVHASADGLDTVLEEEAGISAGQKQLITIARAMIDDAPILILDEATSSVDTRTEKIISDAIDKLMSGRTGFVIAHRLSTIRNADLILVLKDGDIIETGTHDELMAEGGFYADLYMSQFANS
jgi:ABC-type phosphate transport system ATPase subunit